MPKPAYILLEALISAALLVIVVVSIIPIINSIVRTSNQYDYDSSANLILSQSIEIAYNDLLSNWDSPLFRSTNLATSKYFNVDMNPLNTNLTPVSSSTWETIDIKYTRQLTIDRVCRNTSGEDTRDNCASGSIDSKSKLITGRVKWTNANGVAKEKTASLLVYNPNGTL
jgi:hypothetical protein